MLNIDLSRADPYPRRLRFVALAFAVGALTLTGCSAADNDTVSADETPLGHVHGIGVDSTTGAIYAATHGGVFELPAADAAPVAGAALDGPIAGGAQDTMGFVIDGDQMFASGHPAPGEGLDLELPNLGLITSTDAANSWQTLSLRGETDFHDIDVVQEAGDTTVYGLDAATGTIRVSRDGGVTWSEGATLSARDLSADPRSPETVYATTAEGLMVSRDAARTFNLVDSAPPLYLVDSLGDAVGGLIGVDTDGAIWTRSAEGSSWTSRGSAEGEVDALTYGEFPVGKLVVADDRGIAASENFGRTWQVLVAS